MKAPMTLGEIEILSNNDESLKSFLRECFIFPCDTSNTNRLSLRTQAIQRINDIVMFTHAENNKIIEPVFQAFNDHYDSMFNNIGSNPDNVSSFRMTFSNYNDMAQLHKIKCIANESLVINLWTTIEQISNRCLEMILNTVSETRSHRWHGIVRSYEDMNVILKDSSSYPLINELRVLNNKIKHSYIVDKELSSFEFFNNLTGKRIDSIPLRVFDYILATYNFVCFITNRTGESIYFPENEDDDQDQ